MKQKPVMLGANKREVVPGGMVKRKKSFRKLGKAEDVREAANAFLNARGIQFHAMADALTYGKGKKL